MPQITVVGSPLLTSSLATSPSSSCDKPYLSGLGRDAQGFDVPEAGSIDAAGSWARSAVPVPAALVRHRPGWLRLILQQKQSKGVQPQGAGCPSCAGGALLVLTSPALPNKSQGASGKGEGGLLVPGGGTSEQGLVFVQLYLCGFCLWRGRCCKTCVCGCMCSLSCFSPPGNQNRNPDG